MLLQRLVLQEANGKVYHNAFASLTANAPYCIEPPSSATAIAFDTKAETLAVTTAKGEVYAISLHGTANRYCLLDRAGIASTSATFSSMKNKMLFVAFAVS